jgi:hypothetical protein
MGLIEQRAAFRFATDMDADVRMAGEAWSARLRNISTTGCMMACPEEGLPSGWMMRLRIRSLPAIDAEIIWRHRGHAGLRFLKPLEPTALEHLGFHLPETRRAASSDTGPLPSSLHPRLVKRAAPEAAVPAAMASAVRGAPQHVS